MEKTILFDLDGTLTASGIGITKCVQHALEKMGHTENDLKKLEIFIGPPLITQFMEYLNISKEEAEQAVVYYRERYTTIGIFENELYPNVEKMLKTLKDNNYTLAVSSSKPEKFVKQILEHFKIEQYFDEVVGATMSEKRTDKAEVIEETLKRLGRINCSNNDTNYIKRKNYKHRKHNNGRRQKTRHPRSQTIWNTLCRSILRIRNNGRTNKRKPTQNSQHSRRTTSLLTKQLIV